MAERPLKWTGGGGDLIPAPKIKFRRQRDADDQGNGDYFARSLSV